MAGRPKPSSGVWGRRSTVELSFSAVLHRRGTLYVGTTSDLARRIFEHREGLLPGFTKTYRVTRLVYVEPFASIADAFAAERRIKRWRRAWKIALIERDNPGWRDLYDDINK